MFGDAGFPHSLVMAVAVSTPVSAGQCARIDFGESEHRVHRQMPPSLNLLQCREFWLNKSIGAILSLGSLVRLATRVGLYEPNWDERNWRDTHSNSLLVRRRRPTARPTTWRGTERRRRCRRELGWVSNMERHRDGEVLPPTRGRDGPRARKIPERAAWLAGSHGRRSLVRDAPRSGGRLPCRSGHDGLPGLRARWRHGRWGAP